MRICLVADARSILTQRWTEHFIEKGHEVHVLSHSEGDIEGASMYFIGPFQAPKSVDYHSITQLIRISAKTKKLIKKINPDIVHGHYLQDSAFFATRSGFHPLIVSAWGSDVIIYLYRNRAYRIMTLYVLKKADAIHSVADHLTKKLMGLGISPKKIFTIPMGADLSLFHQDVEPIIKNDNIIISTRSLRKIYSIQTLIKAVPDIIKNVKDAKIIIVGDGEERTALQSLADKLNVRKYVRFVGAVPHGDVPKWLRSAKVYVSTSLSDGTSASLLEALACGVFPIVSNIQANRPWIKDGENGFLVSRNDSKFLARRIVEAIEKDDLRESAKNINLKIIRQKANWQENMKEMENIYSWLMAHH